jgi:putative acetyltransferase
MIDSVLIRDEKPGDIEDIYRVTKEAFLDRPYADGNEQDLVNRLRKSGSLVISLVAMLGDDLVGQITFSPAGNSVESDGWFALGPVSVLPEYQSKAIGAALVESGLERLREKDAKGCILTGNPAYYQRFGFELAPSRAPAAEPAEFFMVKLLSARQQAGKFSFHPDFYREDD